MDSLKLFSLLERIATALEVANPAPVSVGFGNPPTPEYIFVSNEGDYLWYFYDADKNQHIAINQKALTGVIKELRITHKEFKGKEQTKLDVHVVADKPYVLRSGLETFFAKGLLLGLNTLDEQKIKSPLTISVAPGRDAAKVVFCNLYLGRERIKTELNPDADWAEIIAKVQGWLGQPVEVEKPQVDRDYLIQRIGNLMEEQGWSVESGRKYLEQVYKKRSRKDLTDAELLDFVEHLSGF